MNYIRLTHTNDPHIPQILQAYRSPSVSRYISIHEGNYWNYVTGSENVYFHKVFLDDTLVATTHCELSDTTLYMNLVVFPEYQGKEIGTEILGEILNGKLGLNFQEIRVSIDETNLASRRLFEKLGFEFVSQDEELLNYVFTKVRFSPLRKS